MKPLASESFPLSGNRLIEASAGTGKTYTITNLYLRLLLGQGQDPVRPLAVNEILVLTFTIAATEELRTRIRRRITDAKRAFDEGNSTDSFLGHLLQQSDDARRDSKLLSAALQLMDEASIFTIHGFCARVLSDNAFETGTLFDQNLDADRGDLLETAVEDCFRAEILTLPSFERAIALGLWPSPEQLLAKLKSFLFRFNLTLIPPPRDVGTELTQLAADIQSVKTRWFSEDFSAAIENAGLRKNSKCLSRLEPMAQWCRSDSLDTDLWENWTSAAIEKALTKAGSFPAHPLIELIDSIVARQNVLIQLQFNLWHQVTGTVKSNIERYKIERSQLTLDDLLTRVHAALIQPRTGEWLAASLASRWPVAMIDEFQDTDDIQYEIFSRIYADTGAHSLFFIGDPKQAIYQFRGADVFTYINAKRRIDAGADVFSLATNWRSTAPLVEAVNFLFDQPAIFDNDADIPFERVSASRNAVDLRMTDKGREVEPITLFQVTSDSGRNKDQIRRMAMTYAAQESARLLSRAGEDGVCIDGVPVHAGQIAILVRDKNDARAAREALAARNIRSVYVTLESVFLTETAEDLRVILQAVLEPTNERALRAALAVPLMQSTASEIAALSTDVTSQQQLLQEFTDYHQLWARLDVASMIERLVIRRRIAQKWFGKHDGERQITNLRHLTELLQRRAAVAPGMHRLLKWFTREKLAADTVATEERQLRLESDKDLVQIVTMHASKGLEYDIVMIPMAAFVAQTRANEPSLFHEITQGSYNTLLDFSDNAEHRELAEREKFAEDMRLLYVAITRAKYKCYLGVPDTRDLDQSALARLLRLDASDPGKVSAQLNSTFAPPLFEVTRAEVTGTIVQEETGDGRDLLPPPVVPAFTDNWRLHSYTGVSRMIQVSASTSRDNTVTFDVTPGFGDDEKPPGGENPDTHGRTRQFTPFQFPRGPRAGVALHTLLEHFDFTRPAEAQSSLIDQCLDRVGLLQNRDKWTGALTDWLDAIVTTPLADGVTLGQIEPHLRLDEMEFHFPLSTGEKMVQLLKAHNYLDPAVTLNVKHLNGMMTGLIDLVFARGNRFYVVDYKSNYLGEAAAQYDEASLQHAIKHHQYDLQYLIYCVALIRYLKSRVPNYSYDTNFGGVCYLFLRGMQGMQGMQGTQGTLDDASKTGVFFDRPDEAFLDQLDLVMGGMQ